MTTDLLESKSRQHKAKKVLLNSPRGFCAGVEMAISSLAWMVKLFPAPVYCYHEIVHNKSVVKIFENAGVIFVDSIDEVPEGAPVMLSAHGSPPDVVNKAKEVGKYMVNAVCPLVTKVHHEAKTQSKKGLEIIYVGHAGHDEAIGTQAMAPNNITLVENVEDFKEKLAEIQARVEDPSQVGLLSQTSLPVEEWKEVEVAAKEHFPEIWTAKRSDLCFATTNRQAAVRAVAPEVDTMVVIGSNNSSNTIALAKVAKEYGAKEVYRIDSVEELEDKDFTPDQIVGVTAGASAPESLIQEVVAWLNPEDGVEEKFIVEEGEYFPLPPNMRNFIDGVEKVSNRLFGSSEEESFMDIQVNRLLKALAK